MTVAEFAKMIKRTPQRVYQLIEDEHMPHRVQGKGRRGYRIVEAEAWEWAYERKQAKEAATNPAAAQASAAEAQARAEKRQYEARIKRVEAEETEGRVHDGAECDAFHREEEAALFAFLMSKLQTFEPDIVRAATPVDARKLTTRMRREILAARREHADELDRDADAIEAADKAIEEPNAA